MGNTFMSALIPKKGRLAATIGHLKKAIAEVAGGEDAALELRANGGDRFYALNGILSSLAGAGERARGRVRAVERDARADGLWV